MQGVACKPSKNYRNSYICSALLEKVILSSGKHEIYLSRNSMMWPSDKNLPWEVALILSLID